MPLPIGHTLRLTYGLPTNASITHLTVVALIPPERNTKATGAELIIFSDPDDHVRQVDLGETIAIGEQTWRLDKVVRGKRPGDRFQAYITRVA
ncbi:DUF6406 domain-containing protein [Allonocardiopsis opalescens]|uniref:Uncharacterized protein n=1 Tax=Allonocardiopsis opalescens TaxID=1144618 RepID=A0A2T0Q9Y5_9ACTN|nr:DUF6406 domain-containing protein [Allonocardiopsis opalescens]PRY00622.1 hypothetical protein CLV72_102253 [Allonocardiopsis opalescens]